MRGMLDSGIVLQDHTRRSRHEALPFFHGLFVVFIYEHPKAGTPSQTHADWGGTLFSLFSYHPSAWAVSILLYMK